MVVSMMTRDECNEHALSWHFNAIRLSTTQKNLDSVVTSVAGTVAKDHPERRPLAEAIAARRKELEQEQAA